MRKSRVFRLLGAVLALPVILIALFFVTAWIGSSIPRNAYWTEPEDGIPILIESNGVHTGIVMPVVTSEKDWRETFPSAGMPRKRDGWMPTHIAIGWGEKEIFLNTPTWGDLKPATALRIVFMGGDGLMRVGHYVNPQPSEYYRRLTLRPTEYRRLVQQIEATLPPVPESGSRKSYESFEPGALHYDASGRYTLTNTCNQWVGDTLANAGVRIGQWTPLAGGVMKWFDNPETD